MEHINLLALVFALATLHRVSANSNLLPDHGSVKVDEKGGLHLNPAFGGRVYINGTDVFTMFEEMQGNHERLKRRVDELERNNQQSNSGIPINEYLHVKNNAIYLQASNGVFISNGEIHTIVEDGGEWKSSSLTVGVGDTLRFVWSSFEGVLQVNDKGNPDGAASEMSLGGFFEFFVAQPGRYYFKAANKGFSTTVDADLLSGVTANANASPEGFRFTGYCRFEVGNSGNFISCIAHGIARLKGSCGGRSASLLCDCRGDKSVGWLSHLTVFCHK